MQHLEGSGTLVLYIGRKVLKVNTPVLINILKFIGNHFPMFTSIKLGMSKLP